MTDDAAGYFTAEQTRGLLNLLDDAEDLEKFNKDEKKALAILIGDHVDLHALVESRRFWSRVFTKFKWFFVQCAALLTAIVSLNEVINVYLKWKGAK